MSGSSFSPSFVSGLSEGNLNIEIQSKIIDFEIERRKIELGLLGRLFGSYPHIYCAMLIAIILLSFAIYYSYIKMDKPSDIIFIWEVVTPIVTLILGYIFGVYQNNN